MRQSIAKLSYLVRDYDEAIDWFTRALDFELIENADLGQGKRWVIVRPRGADGAALLLAKASGPKQAERVGDQTGGRVFLFLETSDIAAARVRMEAAGVRFMEATRKEPYGKVAVFIDLYDNRWDLIEPVAQTT